MITIKKLKSHVLEKLIGSFMLIFALASVYIFYKSVDAGLDFKDIAMIEILLILVLTVLAQTVVLLRIYEQHI